ncbi:MAG TPA: hypothetical protein VF013_06550 [Candidatus Limnocylindria bacterium]
MTNRSLRRAASTRADARRRSRRLAQGHELDELEEEADAEPVSAPARGSAQAGGSFLTRLFPPVPPLPGKPDPLATFTYQGPFRGLVASLYLLARNPVAWMAPAAVWAVGRILTAFSAGVVQIGATIVTFLALLAAGWLGWQRPWLYGLAASILGSLIFALVWAVLLGSLPNVPYATAQLFVVYTLQETFQWLFGILGGWYGGYLRRRSLSNQPPPRARRR